MYLLDTNVLSEIRKIDKNTANAGVVEWASAHDISEMYLSVITIMEIEQGILSLQRKDSAQAQLIKHWLDKVVLPKFEGRILPIDIRAARQCANLRVPDKKPLADALIAATAQCYHLTIVTRNSKDFTHENVALLNPFC